MPVIFTNFDERYTCLENEPYCEFTKKFNSFKDDIFEKEIELKLGDGKNTGNFAKGFYTDEIYCCNPRLKFKFAEIEENKSVFVRMIYSYDYSDIEDLEYHLKRIQALKHRIPYLYISNVSHFDFNFNMDADNFNWNFDVVVPEHQQTKAVCYELINLIIALFAFEE